MVENKNIESNKPNSKDKDKIVFEVKHNVFILDTFYQFFMFLVGLALLSILFIKPPDIVMSFCFFSLGFFLTLNCFTILFYRRKNKIYITNQGVGFERRNWFRMQKKFFKFGEVGMVVFPFGATYQNAEIFILYPFKSKKPRRTGFLPKEYQRITIQGINYNYKEILTFIRQKTKEALESQGITISDAELKDKIKDLGYKDI
ncbi:hypothetical protein [Helicobacter trogontum]|uniref:hypothetical protein n=1 Tax=Helicobacter trogontum TaxID=50960 RepID=UPI00051DD0C6|nr:hypothetical protein [Helicobacter trogontum]MDY5185101.1 hypothetical protein [Helicobacter trogontum]